MSVDWNRKAWLASILLILSIIVLVLGRITGCGVKPREKVVEKPVPTDPADPVTCDEGLAGGETKDLGCDEGQEGEHIVLCTSEGLVDALNTCAAPPADDGGGDDGDTCDDDRTTFEDVKPIIQAKCMRCHASPQPYDQYEVAVGLADKIVNYISRLSDDPLRMPQPESADLLPPEEIELFNAWQDQGLLEAPDCGGGDDGGNDLGVIDLQYIEQNLIRDGNRLDANDRENAAYLVTAHKVNLGSPSVNMTQYQNAMQKALNSLNTTTDDLFKLTPIDPLQVVWRLDLGAYGLNLDDWRTVEAADLVDAESFTDSGIIIKFLFNKRKAWMHFDNFIDTAFRNSEVYYKLTDTPLDFNDLMIKLGVDYAGDFENLDALLVGFNGSPISNNKNRLLSRHEGADGYVWNTYDPVDLDGVPERNLFEFPLLKETGSQFVFDFAAGETIYQLPNGLQGYALHDAKGVRQNVAPIDIVRDTESPVESEIRNAYSCTRCHAWGLIQAQDQVRAKVGQDPGDLGANDVEIVRALYRPNGAVSATFISDNASHGEALSALGLETGQDDPLSFSTDRLLLDWTLQEVAAFLLLDVDEFRILINQSQEGKAQIAQILDVDEPGTITYDQFIQVLPILKRDLRLFQEPLRR